MIHLTKNDLNNLEKFYRANLINSATGYKPANLIGSISEEGVTNLAIFSSVVHLGSDPALIGFIQRPLIDTSHTYKNILSNGLYTINHVTVSKIKDAHQTSGKYQNSEFVECNFTEEFVDDFTAPFVKESIIKIGMHFVEEIPIKYNGTKLMIGEVQHLIIEKNVVAQDGLINLQEAETALVSGLDAYFEASLLNRFDYVSFK